MRVRTRRVGAPEMIRQSPMKTYSAACLLAVLLAGLTCACNSGASTGDRPEHSVLLEAITAEQAHRNRLIDELKPLLSSVVGLRKGELDATIKRYLWQRCLDNQAEQGVAKEVEAVAAADVSLAEATSAAGAMAGVFHRSRRVTANARRMWCGGDGCSGTCTTRCAVEDICFGELCRCVPQCAGKQCGGDGCGGVCGDHAGGCETGNVCDSTSRCVKRRMLSRACEPSCDRGGQPKREALTLADPKQRDHTPNKHIHQQPRATFGKLAELDAYVDALNGRAVALANNVQQHAALTAKIAALQAELKAAKASQAEAKAAAAAKLAATAAIPAADPPDPRLAPAKLELKAAVDAETAATAKVGELTGTLTAAQKQHKRDDPQMQRLARAKARFEAEMARAADYAKRWKAASEAVAIAQTVRNAAVAALDAARTAIGADAARTKQLEAVAVLRKEAQTPLLDEAARAALSCRGARCPIDRRLRGLDGDTPSLASISTKLQERAKHLADLRTLASTIAIPADADGADTDNANNQRVSPQGAVKAGGPRPAQAPMVVAGTPGKRGGAPDPAAAIEAVRKAVEEATTTAKREAVGKLDLWDAQLSLALKHADLLTADCPGQGLDAMLGKQITKIAPFLAALVESHLAKSVDTLRDAALLLQQVDAANQRLLDLRAAAVKARVDLAQR